MESIALWWVVIGSYNSLSVLYFTYIYIYLKSSKEYEPCLKRQVVAKGKFEAELEFLEGSPPIRDVDIFWINTSKIMFENRLGKYMS